GGAGDRAARRRAHGGRAAEVPTGARRGARAVARAVAHVGVERAARALRAPVAGRARSRVHALARARHARGRGALGGPGGHAKIRAAEAPQAVPVVLALARARAGLAALRLTAHA